MLKSFTFFVGFMLGSSALVQAQQAEKVDSIEFHLYTDSLKKGVHNYINVDAKLSSGRWQPLTAKDLLFSASAGRFEGNSLLLDTNFKGEKVLIKAVLKSDTTRWKEVTIYIKTRESDEQLKTVEEVLRQRPDTRSKKRKRN